MPRKPKPKRKPPVSLSDEQLLALLDMAKQHRYRDYVMILTTYWHGFRASETCALRESDYDLAAGTVRFKRGKGSEPGEHELQPFPDNPLLDELTVITWWLANRAQFGVKGGAKRQRVKLNFTPPKMQQSTQEVSFLPPPPEGAPDPSKMRQNRNIVAFSPDDLIFPIERKSFWRIVNRYALAAGIPRRKCKTHTLKHTLAKHLVRDGHALNEIQAYMGWRNIAMLDWYTKADEEELCQRIGSTIRARIGLHRPRQGSLFS